MYALLDDYIRFVEDVCTRYWNVAAGSLRQAAQIMEQGAVRPFDAERLFARLAAEYIDAFAGFAGSIPAAAELAAARASAASTEGPLAPGEAPETCGRLVELPGEGSETRVLALPARVIDASQGWAVYLVSAETARTVLGPAAEVVAPFDAGSGRTFLTVLGMDHRVSDLGTYQELALALPVTPRRDPARPPGPMFVGIGVSGVFTREAGRAVWGIEKVYNEGLGVSYAPERARFGMLGAPGALVVSYPRFGTGRSQRVPLVIYSRRETDGTAAPALASLMSLTGQGQGVQVGGSVSIRLGNANPVACLCRALAENCLCETIARFAIAERLPAANGWVERLSVTLDAPVAVRP